MDESNKHLADTYLDSEDYEKGACQLLDGAAEAAERGNHILANYFLARAQVLATLATISK